MAADILTVADAIVTRITAGLDVGDTTTVSRVYLAPIDLTSLSTRKVFVFPVSYEDAPATRAEDEIVYGIAVICAACFTRATAGQPTNAWIDAQVNFVHEKIVERCDFVRDLLTFETTRRLYTSAISVQIYDVDRLSEDKTFLSEVTFEFRETKED